MDPTKPAPAKDAKESKEAAPSPATAALANGPPPQKPAEAALLEHEIVKKKRDLKTLKAKSLEELESAEAVQA